MKRPTRWTWPTVISVIALLLGCLLGRCSVRKEKPAKPPCLTTAEMLRPTGCARVIEGAGGSSACIPAVEYVPVCVIKLEDGAQ